MRRWRDVTFGETFDALSEYRPVIVLLVGIMVLALVVPGTSREEAGEIRETPPASDVAVDAAPERSPVDAGSGQSSSGAETADERPVTAVTDTTAAPEADAPQAAAAGRQEARVPPAAQWAEEDPMSAPDCDPETGRIAVPDFYAPNCVPLWPEDADNGDATYRGVTEDSILVAYRDTEDDDQAGAMLDDAGVESDDREQEAQDRDRDFVFETVSNLFETYGRTVEWVRFEASGDDEAAARADARRVANEIGAFATIGGSGGAATAWADELAAHGVVCWCSGTLPHDMYIGWEPYIWGSAMAVTKANLQGGEMVGRQLWGRPPEYSPDPNLALEERRRIAYVHYDTEDGAYEQGGDVFEETLARYGAHVDDRIGYVFNLAEAQQQASAIIARLKDRNITTIYLSVDPFYPVFFTQEATRQQYFPEWVAAGYLTDTALFARTYDQQQWRNAVTMAYVPARMSPEYRDDEQNLVEWSCECERESYPGLSSLMHFMRGVHLAGPHLTPETYRDGLFSYKPVIRYITRIGSSYGVDIWDFPDYTRVDDAATAWWDPDAQGEDELGNPGFGLYRYVNAGERYLPGEWPDEDRFFDPEGTLVWYEERPDGEETPQYAPRSSRHEPFERID